MNDQVIEFINRRFSNESNWLSGNCYYFAIILKERFCNHDSELYYDLIEGHFTCKIDGTFYDWQGIVNYDSEYATKYVKKWSTYHIEDEIHWNRIVKDVIM